jgi:hypothetical protein
MDDYSCLFGYFGSLLKSIAIPTDENSSNDP